MACEGRLYSGPRSTYVARRQTCRLSARSAEPHRAGVSVERLKPDHGNPAPGKVRHPSPGNAAEPRVCLPGSAASLTLGRPCREWEEVFPLVRAQLPKPVPASIRAIDARVAEARLCALLARLA